MAQINVIGFVTEDLALRQGQKEPAYVRFLFKEQIGNSRYQYYNVWVWGNLATHMIRLNIKKGSMLLLSGSLEPVTKASKDGKGQNIYLNIHCKYFEFIPLRRTEKQSAESMNAESAAPGLPVELDGDRNQLPE